MKLDAIKHVATNTLIPYAANSRTHSQEQVAQIAASIKEFGFTNPVLTDGDNGIIAGHGRVEAAKMLGLDSVPTIELAHLTPAQRKAYIIADNKLALNAGWDIETLQAELEGLQELNYDLELTGFNHGEISALWLEGEFAPGSEDEQGRLDQLQPKMVECPNCGESFDSRSQN